MMTITRSKSRRSVTGVLAGFSAVAAVVVAAVWTGVSIPGDPFADRETALSSAIMGNGFEPWTCVASDGTVDEADFDLYNVAGTVMALPLSAPADSTLNVRYNVTSVDGLINNLGCVQLIARFRDNGAGAQVIVRLKRYRIDTGATATLLTVDSNDFPHQGGFQFRSEHDCDIAFDFFNFSYYLDVELRKITAAGNPGLAMMRISTFPE